MPEIEGGFAHNSLENSDFLAIIHAQSGFRTFKTRSEHRGQFPVGVDSYISYGPRLKVYAVGLIEGHFVGLGQSRGDPGGSISMRR